MNIDYLSDNDIFDNQYIQKIDHKLDQHIAKRISMSKNRRLKSEKRGDIDDEDLELEQYLKKIQN